MNAIVVVLIGLAKGVLCYGFFQAIMYNCNDIHAHIFGFVWWVIIGILHSLVFDRPAKVQAESN